MEGGSLRSGRQQWSACRAAGRYFHLHSWPESYFSLIPNITVQAKKIRLLACGEQLEFNEVFSIVLPARYLHTVTCSLTLCSRSRIGVKVRCRNNIWKILTLVKDKILTLDNINFISHKPYPHSSR